MPSKEYRQKYPEKCKEQQHKSYMKNRKKYLDRVKNQRDSGYFKKYYQSHKKELNEYRKVYNKTYKKTEKYLKNRKDFQNKYSKTEKRIAWRKQYYQKNHEKFLKELKERAEWRKNYYQKNKEKFLIRTKEYRKTPKGKIKTARHTARRRKKKWIQLLPNIFPDDIQVHFHHIDGKFFVVPLPRDNHLRSCNPDLNKHISAANDWVEFFYDIHPNQLLYDCF